MLNSCSVKFSYQRKAVRGSPPALIRRASLNFDSSKDRPVSMEIVTQLARQLYRIDDNFDIGLTWVDEDADVVTMSTELEFDEYLKVLRNSAQLSRQNPNLLKFGLLLRTRSQPTQRPQNVEVMPVVETAVPEKAICPEMLTQRQTMLNTIRAQRCAAGVDAEKAPLLKKAAFVALEAAAARNAAPVCSPFKTGVLKDMEDRKLERDNAEQASYKASLLNELQHARLRATTAAQPTLSVRNCGPAVHQLSNDEQSFRTAWTVRNDGSTDFTNLTLIFDRGTPMPIAGTKADHIHKFRYSIGTIKANSSKKIVLNLATPSTAGEHTAHYQLINATGDHIGTSLKVSVNRLPPTNPPPVANQPTAAPASTPPEYSSVAQSSAAVAQCEDDMNYRRWACELAVLKQMGFFDRRLNVQLLQKHVRMPSDAPVGETSNLSNYALCEIVTELTMLQEQEELQDDLRRINAHDHYASVNASAMPQRGTSADTEPELPILDIESGSSSAESEEDFVMLLGGEDNCY